MLEIIQARCDHGKSLNGNFHGRNQIYIIGNWYRNGRKLVKVGNKKRAAALEL